MKYAQYDLATGMIAATNTFRVDDDLLPAGVAQVAIDADVFPERHKINLRTLLPEPLPQEE